MNLTVGVCAKELKETLPRYELKMVTSRSMQHVVTSWLMVHSQAFFVRYPARRVNNVYFDTPDLDRFAENLSGASERRKVRLRWYGHDASDVKGVFEVKCKRNKLGWKITQSLTEPLDMERNTWSNLLSTVRQELTDELRLQLDLSGSPVVINGYDREYFLSADGAIRVTLDYALAVYDQRHGSRPNLKLKTPVPDDMVVEIKARADTGERLLDSLAGLGLRVSKRSKYALGMAAVLGY